ncbi:hypothetical protein J1N35_005309 [Gossypium stocksii]|uniref:CCHC-type domain-containing protein n=1 Tax=Gossypium stocksii TaxID=47602 RepID=A0A9D4AIH8_9ROSI|nr:hypothetical protein J1N35_005309 [Gossypium stocksii]
MVFKSLSKDFAGFRAAYNLGNKNLVVTQLIELQSYELMLNDRKGKRAKKGKSKIFRPLQVERKRSRNPKDLYKFKCFSCNKKGHFKTNCKEWKEYLATKGKGEFGETKDLRDKSLSLRGMGQVWQLK